MNTQPVKVIGAGLAGSEAAWQLAIRGIPVRLYEMKPGRMSPAHHSAGMAELVCSNSLRSDRLSNAVGLLKQELRLCHSLIMRAADATRVPAGGALAVDRQAFSDYVTEKIRSHPLIEVTEREVTEIPEGNVIIATGPLTSEALSASIAALPGLGTLNFYDAAAPIVMKDSLDLSLVFRQSRYDRGDDYLNCPMNEQEYRAFYEALISAETAEVHGFEENRVFEGCMPVESMARRGYLALAYGPLKPVGLTDPRTGKLPFAVVQLRQDNADSTMYNLVGFQTRLKFPEQKRVFGMIPGLANAEFARYGVMHRNTYLASPGFLNANFEMISREGCFFAGQMTGVEGYVESTASGCLAAIAMAHEVLGTPEPAFPGITAIGAMGRYVSTPNRNFQPMNCAFGLIDQLKDPGIWKRKNKLEKYEKISERSLAWISAWAAEEYTGIRDD